MAWNLVADPARDPRGDRHCDPLLGSRQRSGHASHELDLVRLDSAGGNQAEGSGPSLTIASITRASAAFAHRVLVALSLRRRGVHLLRELAWLLELRRAERGVVLRQQSEAALLARDHPEGRPRRIRVVVVRRI